jgi:hypothetical protein
VTAPLARLAEDQPGTIAGYIPSEPGGQPRPVLEPASVCLSADVTGCHVRFWTYDDRDPIGVVDLGPVEVRCLSGERALEIAAAFTELAARFHAAAVKTARS